LRAGGKVAAGFCEEAAMKKSMFVVGLVLLGASVLSAQEPPAKEAPAQESPTPQQAVQQPPIQVAPIQPLTVYERVPRKAKLFVEGSETVDASNSKNKASYGDFTLAITAALGRVSDLVEKC
jgi:hypothetical protein